MGDYPATIDNPSFTTPDFAVNNYLPDPPDPAPENPPSTNYGGKFRLYRNRSAACANRASPKQYHPRLIMKVVSLVSMEPSSPSSFPMLSYHPYPVRTN